MRVTSFKEKRERAKRMMGRIPYAQISVAEMPTTISSLTCSADLHVLPSYTTAQGDSLVMREKQR